MGEAALNLYCEPRTDVRSGARASLHASVDLSSEHNFWTGLTMNISEGGLFVATYNVVPIGTVLVVNMLIPFEHDPIVTLAEVRWTRECSEQTDVPPGLGLRFVDTDEASLAKIRRFVMTLREPLFFEE